MALVRRGNQEITKRYRPRKLSEIIGNESVTKAMAQALEGGESRQTAYLLFGEAGSGKTTTARIMAMGLNCETGDTGEPCLECEDCKSAMLGNAYHIQELNLARINTKEDAENIVQEMGLTTLTGRNKIYIFDEAQMLTKQAQNLLLKNLEEPPPHTYVFICTTEPNKIIKAIRSRCEKHEFRVPTRQQTVQILQDVFPQEPDWKGKLTKEDKVKFLDAVDGFSPREILKAIDQVVKGGVESLSTVELDEPPIFLDFFNMLQNGEFKKIVDKVDAIKKDEKQPDIDLEALRRYFCACFVGKLKRMGVCDEGCVVFDAMECFLDPYFDPVSAKYKFYHNVYKACFILN